MPKRQGIRSKPRERLPDAWLQVATDVVRRAGLGLALKALAEFVRAAAYAVGPLGSRAAGVAAQPVSAARAPHKGAQADALARLRALIGLQA